jgi:hypothetical protein
VTAERDLSFIARPLGSLDVAFAIAVIDLHISFDHRIPTYRMKADIIIDKKPKKWSKEIGRSGPRLVPCERLSPAAGHGG